ncbi:antistasin-like isoform X2 [Babylonia areolata]|uniref:antistasin-like isoform X2 n=1 Tax=Babylonia areolata TaxID=304850 RepID=UPI003FD64710
MGRVTYLCELTVFLLVVVCSVNSLSRYPPDRPVQCGNVCRRYCPNGFQTDSRGCPVCRCKTEPVRPPCGGICKRFCPNGFLKDGRGCPVCQCRPCPLVRCSRHCPHGYQTVRGCQTCQCKHRCSRRRCLVSCLLRRSVPAGCSCPPCSMFPHVRKP